MDLKGNAEEGKARRVSGPERDSVCRFIETLVGSSLGVSLGEMRDAKRGRATAAFARQTAMYLAHVQLGLSLSQVGRSFGRDRTTVAHACARVEDSRDDPHFDRVVTCLESAIERWRGGFLALGGA
jgi:chromosomal replication initiation ATPase DnaA